VRCERRPSRGDVRVGSGGQGVFARWRGFPVAADLPPIVFLDLPVRIGGGFTDGRGRCAILKRS
jgi:hypothetical protein